MQRFNSRLHCGGREHLEFAQSGYSLHVVAREGRGEERQRGNALRAELNEIKLDFIPINFKTLASQFCLTV